MAGARWGAHYDVLRQTTLSVVNSVADFGSPIWLNSKHTNLVDVQLNETLRIVSGSIHATPLIWLPAILFLQNWDERKAYPLLPDI